MDATIAGGTVWLLRLLDVAEVVDIDRARVASALRGARRGAKQIRGPEKGPSGARLATEPLDLDVGTVQIDGVSAACFVRLFDFGVASVRFRIALEAGTSCGELIRFAARLERLVGVDAAAREAWRTVAADLGDALRDPHEIDLIEDYTLFEIVGVMGRETGLDAISALEPAKLLLAEPERALAPSVAERHVARALQYYADDAAVIGWNAGVVIDPEGSRDELEILEIASARLLELRYYDRLLARELAALSAASEDARTSQTLFRSPYVRVARRAATLYVEIADLYDRVEGALTLVGDAYTARLYREAADRFRLNEFSCAVREKLNTLSRVSEIFQAEIGHRRALVLEGIVALLIVLEIVLALFRPH